MKIIQEEVKSNKIYILYGVSTNPTGYFIASVIVGPLDPSEVQRIPDDAEEQQLFTEFEFTLSALSQHASIGPPDIFLQEMQPFEFPASALLLQQPYRLDEKLVETEFDNTEDQYHYIVNKLHEAAKEALGETEETRTNHPLYYWNEEIKKEVKLKKEKYLKWLNTRNLQDKIELNAQQAKIRKKVAEAKNKVWEQSCQKIESYIGGKRNTEAWKTIKNLRRNSKETTHIKYITHDSWEKYFKSLLTENREEYLGNPEYNEMIDLQAENYIRLEIETVKTAIKSLKNGRATGIGGIPVELLKLGTKKLMELLRNLFERCLNGEDVPNDLKVGYISVIHKKGAKDECKNYRGITVTNTFSRLYGRIIKYLLEQEYEEKEAEEQAGFRAGRSTIDHIFAYNKLLKKNGSGTTYTFSIHRYRKSL
ncbi:uncharacterized protein LOC124776352 [Schistocerca piceifrons]|uniref:uncharacterized protein LOC124776352 n=1 Tax=Schistocerca piceifrons TaxID=274613 RepID=UPI001F5FA1C3|nr:uncharacterized protein LOC124776352 [Schistocerca piceifrons]